MPAELSPPLDFMELRVLAALLEKEITTPEYYPLSLNALTNACNQKTNREPVSNYSDDDVRDALERLRHRGLSFVRTGAGSRVEKFGSRLQEQLNFGRAELAVLTELMLRGPQTVGELRTRAERMHRFDDLDQVERALLSLTEWQGKTLVTQLPRQPGTKEPRWAHLLSGEPVEQPQQSASASERNDRLSTLEARVQQLSEEVATLRADLSALLKQLT